MAKKRTKDVFQAIAERWFLTEPALFSIYCTHRVKQNGRLSCAMRTGRGDIEYNPALVFSLPEYTVEELLRAEILRILLKHPYQRKPFGCSDTACTLASDCVLSSYYSWKAVKLTKASDFNLPDRQHYEWYAREIEKLLEKKGTPSQTSEGGGDNNDDIDSSQSSPEGGEDNDGLAPSQYPQNGTDEDGNSQSASIAEQSALWEEDSLMQVNINDIIENTKSWGTLPGNIVEVIISSTKARIDYRKVLSGFRASVISSRRSLTRMRPNRRTGFQNMGSLYRFRTRLLVGIDVSGSVDSATLAHVYSVVNRFFKYGIESIDVVQFDSALGEVRTLSKASRNIEITGRGGTDFQPVVDYACTNRYDGLVIFTDGYAPIPTIPPHTHTRLLWVCQDDDTYREHHEWMEKTGRVCVIYR